MPAKVLLRELTAEVHQAGERLARSRTDEARLVQRARVIERLAVGEGPRLGRPHTYDAYQRAVVVAAR